MSFFFCTIAYPTIQHRIPGNSESDESTSESSSSSDSASSEDSTKLLKRLQQKQEQMINERRKQKELLKATETAEEKRIRRLLKKEAKERLRKQRMGWDKDYLHYTNADNPFGDANLLSTFVWSKKLAKDGLAEVTNEELERLNRRKQEENKLELEKVKKRRQEREQERQEREEAMMRQQREKEAAQFESWATQEDEFHLEQARLRSKIRISDGRAKPIDLLAKYINSDEEVDAVEMTEPYTYLNGLSIKDLEDLLEDIKVYIKLEHGKNLDYWNDITVIVDDELYRLRKLEKKSEIEAAVGRRDGIHESVATEVASVFKGKTANQLAAMQKQIEKKINEKEGVDIGYWESLLSQLKAHMARARLRDKHQENLRKKLELLKAAQNVVDEMAGEGSIKLEPEESDSNSASNDSDPKEGGEEPASSSEDEVEEDAGESILKQSFEEYKAGNYSPRYTDPSALELGTIVIDEGDDEQRLMYARLRLTAGAPPQEQRMHNEARKGMSTDEAVFSVESALDSQVYLWSDKYRPRKPRYFNRLAIFWL
ncbi:unnamed protein product [Nesidiocoris tenuis]|uniref:Splicing factor cactin central domain-containing protein n=1 Tax=Nesidiocoris tenuis TaxID=355587 RepID=A0A6H5GUX7_9HEMI|nr:unnamed protein product [Nesidiocoris tenuis]